MTNSVKYKSSISLPEIIGVELSELGFILEFGFRANEEKAVIDKRYLIPREKMGNILKRINQLSKIEKFEQDGNMEGIQEIINQIKNDEKNS